jgi:hypothetical protein
MRPSNHPTTLPCSMAWAVKERFLVHGLRRARDVAHRISAPITSSSHARSGRRMYRSCGLTIDMTTTAGCTSGNCRPPIRSMTIRKPISALQRASRRGPLDSNTAAALMGSSPPCLLSVLMTKKRPVDIAEIKAKLGPTKPTPKRVDASLHLLREFQCPRCQLEGERRSLLVPIPGVDSDGILRCYFCGEDFPAPDRDAHPQRSV